MTVREILAAKGSKVVTVPSHTTVAVAALRMGTEQVGALVVSDDGGRSVAGIVSERDIVRALPDLGAGLGDRPVAELMSRAVATCAPGDNLRAVMRVMTTRRFRHLPVVDGGRLVGLVSIGDVVKRHIDDIELEANVLRDMAASHG